MPHFEPLGEVPRWRTLYGLLQAVPVEGILTYEAMAVSLGLDSRADRQAIQMAMRRAAKEHEIEDQRAIESVPNVGYRVVRPEEHLVLARTHQKRSGKSLVRGRSKIVNVDLNGMQADVRRSFEIFGHAFAMQMEMNERFAGKQARMEAAMESNVRRHDRSDVEMADLQARLAKIESATS